MKLREISKKEFEDFCEDEHSQNFFQSKEWAELKRSEGYHTYFVGLDQNGKVRAAAMILSTETKVLKKRVFYCPRGYIINFRDLELVRAMTKGIVEFAKDKDAIYLRLSPYVLLRERNHLGEVVDGGQNNQKCRDNLLELGYLPVEAEIYKEPKWLYQLDLKGKSDIELFEYFNDDAKAIIKRNESIGISSRNVSKEEIPKFLELFKNNQNKIDFLGYNVEEFQNFYQILDKQRMVDLSFLELDIDKFIENTITSIQNAQGNSELVSQLQRQLETANKLQYQYGHSLIIGGACSIIYRGEASSLCHVVNDRFSNFSPLYNLYYDLIKVAKKRSCHTFTFYGIDKGFATNSLFNLYKDFHGEVVELIGEYDLVFNDFYYNREVKRLINQQQKKS